MADFLLQYGLFTAKVITLVLGIIAVLGFTLFKVSQKETHSETIEIEKLNDKFEQVQDLLESEILSKEELKALKKNRKQQDKLSLKENKKKIKSGHSEPLRPRLFVLRFNGDMHASEVSSLRETVTAVLSVGKKGDEVVVILESAGGLVHSYGLAASQLDRIRGHQMRLTVCIDLVAASGGYLMAAVANKIIAAPFAVVGSIGVLAQIPNFHRLLKKHDIDVEQLTAGEYKRTLTMLGENTKKARDKFCEELEETHDLFKKFVHQYRPSLDIEKIATGEHWYGTQAMDLNLVDELMTSDDYLLQKSKEWDIYEIHYLIPETFSDKISNILHGVSARLLQRFSAPLLP